MTDCQTDGRPDERTDSLAVCVLAHLIRIFMHALHCHQGESCSWCCLPPAPPPSCHLRNQHNCAAHQARRLTPCPSPHLLHSLGACHDGSNQTFYTCPTTIATTTRSTAGVKWRVAASGGKWQVAALLSICISSSSSGSPCRRRLLLLTDSWHKLTSKRYLKRPSILCEPVAIGIEWAAGQSSMLPHFVPPCCH